MNEKETRTRSESFFGSFEGGQKSGAEECKKKNEVKRREKREEAK